MLRQHGKSGKTFFVEKVEQFVPERVKVILGKHTREDIISVSSLPSEKEAFW